MSSKETIGSVMIVGGGIGGIQSALDLANSGYYVYMVEKSPSIGGKMAQLDKTFPTNDCSMCIMSPKLVELGRHINIELLTLSEITEVNGEPGNFEVTVFEKARYVDMEKCIACGACTEKCPKKVEDVYNEKLVKRKAIYALYPQAVPLKYSIDPANCIKLTKDKCGNCEKECPADAILFDDTDKTHDLNVGSIILAPGFKAHDPSGNPYYAYDNNPDVVTSLEFERLLSASGPNQGHLIRPSDHKEPDKVAWFQCVGSRDINNCNNSHCSAVCCMYAIKQAIIAKEHDPSLECTIFYMDMRTHGKGFENCYNEAKDKYGIKFVRCRVHSVFSEGEKGTVIDYFDEAKGVVVRDNYDIIVLSVGIEIDAETRDLTKKLEIELTDGNFVKTDTFNPVSTSRKGIYVCGALQGPKDIPQTVIEAGAAALVSGSALSSTRNTLTKKMLIPEEIDIRGDRPRIGVFVCHCGINISSVIDVAAVRDFAKDLPFVEYVEDNLYSCSQDTQELISTQIREKGLNRIVVAACTPRTHDPLFQETLVEASLNKYLFEMVNIRNHGSWVHKDFPAEATQKSKDLVRMAVAKVAQLEPLKEEVLEIHQDALVIGGGISGITSAKALSEQGYKVTLLEKSENLGGNANLIHKTANGQDVALHLDQMKDSVYEDNNIEILTGAELKNVDGFVGNFTSTIDTNGNKKSIQHGVTIIATGALEYKPNEYLYGEDDRILTGLELDQKFKENAPFLAESKVAVFIQCVGSRNNERPFCSRICCSHSVLSALSLKEKNPGMKIFVLYRDIRTYGEKENLYKEAREKGIVFIRYGINDKPVVKKEKDILSVVVTDHVLQRKLNIQTDLITLASAIAPNNNDKLGKFFKIPVNDEGFFAEAHVKLAPSDFATDGVFLCGLAHYPKPIDESIAQAQAAASSATRLLSRKTINTIGTTAKVNSSYCSSCGSCIEICPYNAPDFITEGNFEGLSEINPLLCKGCGACAASCRSGAIYLRGFEEFQIMEMIENV
ncbi:MAG: CoB--CoM heterodisulfide reductase iron-sulfur subunit A family protein [Desulfobacterales bacterium]|nr:CoB--CoM heterodisulfide reductase iron-sulfur subunit A family protein [Desulfobacterales bacterium]